MTDGDKLGLYRLRVEDGGFITGVVYMAENGDLHFVAPNWCKPGLVAIPHPKHRGSDPITERLWTAFGTRLVFIETGRGSE